MDDSENQTQIVIFEHLCSQSKVVIDSRYLEQGMLKAGILKQQEVTKFKDNINKIKGGPPKPLFPNLANAKM